MAEAAEEEKTYRVKTGKVYEQWLAGDLVRLKPSLAEQYVDVLDEVPAEVPPTDTAPPAEEPPTETPAG